MMARWAALDQARQRQVHRDALVIDGHVVGSVDRAHAVPLAAWPHWIERRADGVWHFTARRSERDAALATMNLALRAQGLIRAWRDETYAIVVPPGPPALALIERGAARFWGTLTFGAHCNGYLAGAHGRPTHLWIARRAPHKATDPGKLDNLVGGGVPYGQTPFETLVREGLEEAGLDAATMRGARSAGVIALACDVAEGFMHEHLHAFDLCLPLGLTPANLDGEVAEFHLLPVAEAIERAAAGEMTVDAALVTLDFALRHGLLAHDDAQALSARLAPLRSAVAA